MLQTNIGPYKIPHFIAPPQEKIITQQTHNNPPHVIEIDSNEEEVQFLYQQNKYQQPQPQMMPPYFYNNRQEINQPLFYGMIYPQMRIPASMGYYLPKLAQSNQIPPFQPVIEKAQPIQNIAQVQNICPKRLDIDQLELSGKVYDPETKTKLKKKETAEYYQIGYPTIGKQKLRLTKHKDRYVRGGQSDSQESNFQIQNSQPQVCQKRQQKEFKLKSKHVQDQV